jgi:hypothetical protein
LLMLLLVDLVMFGCGNLPRLKRHS